MAAPVSQEYIEIAERLAAAARPIARRYFRSDVAIESKSDASPVTQADREIESAMRDILRDCCPEHAIVGEEMGGAPDQSVPMWILDPIDGTKAFATGTPVFGTLIGLVIEKRFVLGVIDQPISEEKWLGVADRETTFNGAPVRVSGCEDLAQARLYTTAPDYFEQDAYDAFQRVRKEILFTRYGADCYAFGLMASGFVDLIVESQLNLWDFAALIPVIEGAGGVITDWDGAALSIESEGHLVAASSPALHEAALRLLSA